MKPVVQIFSKDVRQLWPEIVAFWLLLGVLTARTYEFLLEPWDYQGALTKMGSSVIPLLVILGAGLLVVRVIQSDSLVGDRQFWVTRPIAWHQLLAAKVLFVLLLLNLPLLVADSIQLYRAGFDPAQFWSVLLWRQILWSGVVLLPAGALAVLLGDVAGAARTAIAFYVLLFVVARLGLLYTGNELASLEWAQRSLQFSVVVLGCVVTILWQYSRRTTTRGLGLFATTMALVFLLEFMMPWGRVISLLYRPSSSNAYTQALAISYDPDPALYPTNGSSQKSGFVSVDIPLRVSGLPSGYIVAVDALRWTIDANGRSWSIPWQRSSNFFSPAPAPPDRLYLTLSEPLYREIKGSPVHMHISLAITVLKEQISSAIAGARRFSLSSAASCQFFPKGRQGDTVCWSPGRTPYEYWVEEDHRSGNCYTSTGNARLVLSMLQPSRSWVVDTNPFPAEFGAAALVSFTVTGTISNYHYGPEASVQTYPCAGMKVSIGSHTIVTRTLKDLDIREILLDNYEPESRFQGLLRRRPSN